MRGLFSALITLFLLSLVGCLGSDSTDGGSSPGSTVKTSVNVVPLDDLLQQSQIDLADYMTSVNIVSGQSNLVYFRHEVQSGNDILISVTKFNESNNIEVFQADSNYIYIRYESTPESYGGIQDVVRRFESISPTPFNSENVDEAMGDSSRGAVWSKRFINASDLGVPMITANKADVFNFTSPGQVPSFRNQYSYGSGVMYIWHDLQRISTSVPFVSSANQPDHKLIISQQWSACNTEEYEYAQGIGYVGWRSLVSMHSSCSHLFAGHESNTKKVLKNYYRNSQDETYVVVQGMAVDAPIDTSGFSSVSEPSFVVGGLFLDDYPYYRTSMNNNLSALRSGPAQPPSQQDNYESLIRGSYVEILVRQPEQAGLNFYLGVMNSGFTLSQLRNDLLGSDEYAIGELYRLHLGRDPDQAGMDFYLGLVQAGSISVDPGVKNDLRQSPACVNDCL